RNGHPGGDRLLPDAEVRGAPDQPFEEEFLRADLEVPAFDHRPVDLEPQTEIDLYGTHVVRPDRTPPPDRAAWKPKTASATCCGVSRNACRSSSLVAEVPKRSSMPIKCIGVGECSPRT